MQEQKNFGFMTFFGKLEVKEDKKQIDLIIFRTHLDERTEAGWKNM